MANKMTNKNALTIALTYVPEDQTEVREKLQRMMEQLDKKNAGPKKLTATQKANLTLGEHVVTFLQDNPEQRYMVADLLKTVPELEGLSSQKVSAILRKLVEDGKVSRVEEKRKAYFQAVDEVWEG